ncbi:MAG TPA: hypothetical protein PLS00_01040 [Niabella sp.]|nr:hypothetical protein [Niabella sp.]
MAFPEESIYYSFHFSIPGPITDSMKQEIEANCKQVKLYSTQIVENEPERIKNEPDLQHLVQQK